MKRNKYTEEFKDSTVQLVQNSDECNTNSKGIYNN